MAGVFLKPNNPLLRKTSKQISQRKTLSNQTQRIIIKMLKIAKGEQGNPNKPVMVGLAGPQIGILKRIILVDLKANGKGMVGDLRVFINPKIVWQSKKKAQWYEGCYSLPEVCGIVSRPVSVKIKGFTLQPRRLASRSELQAKLSESKFTGYVARIFQHEIDHLNGKFFVDLISDPNHLHHVKPEEFPLYRDRQAWKNWPKKYSLPLASLKLKKV